MDLQRIASTAHYVGHDRRTCADRAQTEVRVGIVGIEPQYLQFVLTSTRIRHALLLN